RRTTVSDLMHCVVSRRHNISRSNLTNPQPVCYGSDPDRPSPALIAAPHSPRSLSRRVLELADDQEPIPASHSGPNQVPAPCAALRRVLRVPSIRSVDARRESLLMSPGNDGYIAVEELTKTLGLHPNALRKRIAGSGIAVYSDPYDRRRRLILAEDAERL